MLVKQTLLNCRISAGETGKYWSSWILQRNVCSRSSGNKSNRYSSKLPPICRHLLVEWISTAGPWTFAADPPQKLGVVTNLLVAANEAKLFRHASMPRARKLGPRIQIAAQIAFIGCCEWVTGWDKVVILHYLWYWDFYILFIIKLFLNCYRSAVKGFPGARQDKKCLATFKRNWRRKWVINV